MQTDNSLNIFDYYICLQLMKFSYICSSELTRKNRKQNNIKL